MEPTNTGSFGSAAGGMSPELQAAIQRRAGGNPSGTMGQVTQGSPNFDPTIQQPQVNSVPAPSGASISPPTTGTGAGLSSTPGTSSGLPSTPETELIVKALDSRLKSLSKIQGG